MNRKGDEGEREGINRYSAYNPLSPLHYTLLVRSSVVAREICWSTPCYCRCNALATAYFANAECNQRCFNSTPRSISTRLGHTPPHVEYDVCDSLLSVLILLLVYPSPSLIEFRVLQVY